MRDGNEKQYDFVGRSQETGLLCEDPSLTVQADKEDADINTIVRRFGITGRMPENLRAPSYIDYEGVYDFHSAQLAIAEAQDRFMEVPAEIRATFDNDPQRFLEFCSNADNLPLMREMGLAIPEKIIEAPVVPEVPAKPTE